MTRPYRQNRSARFNWTKDNEDFLRANYLKGKRFCAENLNASQGQITSRLFKLKLNVSANPRVYSDLRTKFNHFHYLDFSKPTNCYLMGLFWADGCLSINESNRRFSFVLVKEDFDEIRWILEESPIGWFIVNRASKNRREVTQARCHNFTYLEFLESCDFKIKSGASANKILAHIPDHLKHYWWRGYFDGDGWFTLQRALKYGFGFSSVIDQEWNFCWDISKNINLSGSYISIKKTVRGNSSEFCCNNFDGARKFGEYIYQGYPDDKIGLSRKYLKFLLMKETKLESQKYFLKHRV